MRIKYADLLSGKLPPGFKDYHEVMIRGRMSADGGWVIIGEDGGLKMEGGRRKPDGGDRKTSKREWPAWAKTLAAQRIEGEMGVGDTARRLIHSPGMSLLADIIIGALTLFGKKCGCAQRQAEWNARFSYSSPS